MLFLILDVDHLLAFFAFSDVTTAISFMKINAIGRKHFMAVGALLGLAFH